MSTFCMAVTGARPTCVKAVRQQLRYGGNSIDYIGQ